MGPLTLALSSKSIPHHFANCQNTARYCISFCTDIDECLSNPCGELEDCVNTPGNYMCLCPDGLTQNTTTGACEGDKIEQMCGSSP